MNTLFGHEVVVLHPQPKMRLSKAVPVTDEFRAEIDAWMLEFFGMQEPLIAKDRMLVVKDPFTGQKTIFCSEEQLLMLRKLELRDTNYY